MSSINTRIKQKYDTSTNWTTNNPILLQGEIGVESDTNKIKIGNGISSWSQLPYSKADGEAIWGSVTGTLSNQTDLQTALNNAVHKTGDESIAGTKSFTERPLLVQSSSSLPSEYQEVEYLESSGTQYINTGVIPSSTISYKLKATYHQAGFVMGSRLSNSNAVNSINFDAATPVALNARFGSNGTILISTTTTFGTTYEINVSNGNSSIYNADTHTLITSNTNAYGTSYSSLPIYLFTVNNNGSPGASAYSINRIYSVIIKDNGTAIRNFVPCYRKSDDVIGMYDIVNNEFYDNDGTGVFLKGPNTINSDTFAVTSEIPTKTSQLTNDSGFLTRHQSLTDLGITATSSELNVLDGITASTTELNYVDGVTSNIQTQLNSKANTSSLATVATSGSYNDLLNKPTIATITITPTTVTDGTNTLDISNKLSKTENTGVSVLGVTKNTTSLGGNQLVAPNGMIFSGTAANAGLVTRGICGVTTPTTTGSCTKDNLYINYDGNNNFNASRQVVVNAGVIGNHLGSNMYQYTLPRGEIVKNWVEAKGYITSASLPTVNNGTLTIQKNGTNVATFSANQSSNVTANISIPIFATDQDYTAYMEAIE